VWRLTMWRWIGFTLVFALECFIGGAADRAGQMAAERAVEALKPRRKRRRRKAKTPEKAPIGFEERAR
jgi:hypothetical protein